MDKTLKLTEGNIVRSLIALSLPIMGTSFIQMAYNMTDMIWIGKLGSGSVAAVGTAGFFTWFAMALIIIPKIGAEIGVSQSLGRKDSDSARCFARCSIQVGAFFSIFYALLILIFKESLIGFFNIDDHQAVRDAVEYVFIVSFGMPFFFLNPVFTGIFNGHGDSATPFWVNAAGLLVNIILDPLLIFGVGFAAPMGVRGAAIATLLSQIVAFGIFVVMLKKKTDLLESMNIFKIPERQRVVTILRLGMPVALENGLFTIFTMVIARVVAQWGSVAIAVQKVGAQVEAISWMTSMGFATALGTFVGQNFGAGRKDRITRGYFAAIGMVFSIGIAAMAVFLIWPRGIFSMFLSEKTALAYGVDYLRILALSQVFMCIEITVAGAFNGIGRTLTPSVIGIVFTGIRVPLAFAAAAMGADLNSIWWIITLSSIVKGVLLFVMFIPHIKNGYGLCKLKEGTIESPERIEVLSL